MANAITRMSIRAKLLALFIIVSFVPVLLLGYTSLAYFNQTIVKEVESKLRTFADFREEEIHLYLQELMTRVSDFASDGFIRDRMQALKGGSEEAQRIAELNQHLRQNKQVLDERIVLIELTDAVGEVVASTNPAMVGRAHPTHDSARIGDTIYETDIFLDDGRAVIELIAPLYSRTETRKYLGEMIVRFDTNLLNAIMTSQWRNRISHGNGIAGPGLSAETYLVNGDRLMINQSRFIDKELLSIGVDTYPVVQCLDQGRSISGRWQDYRGVTVMGVSKCLSMSGFRWVLLAEMDESEAAGLLQQEKGGMILVMAAILLLIATAAIFISRVFSAPIERLLGGMKRIAGGELNYKLATGGSDELGRLSVALDQVVDAFKNSKMEVEQTNFNLNKSNQELAYLKQAMDQHAIIAETDAQGRIIGVNQKFCEISQYPADELLGETHAIVNSGLHPQSFFAEMWQQIAGGNVWHGDICNRRKDGTFYWVSTTIVPHYSRDGVIDRFTALRTDITHQKKIEEKIRRSNRALMALSRIQTAIINAKDERGLLENICKVLVDDGGYRLAWIGYAMHDEQKCVLPVAQAGYEEGYLDSIKITWADTELGRGPVGSAIRSKQACIIRDVRTDLRFRPWLEQAARRGYASVISLPLLRTGEVYGVLTIYAADANAFDSEEVRLLKQLADDTAYGIQSIHVRQERDRAVIGMEQSEKNLKRAQAIAHLGSWEWDVASGRHVWSDEQYRIFGLRPAEVSASFDAFMYAVHPFDRERVKAHFDSALRSCGSSSLDFRVVRPDGDVRHVASQMVVYCDETDKPQRLAGTMLDISEQKRTEDEKDALQHQLQHSQKLHAIGQLTGGIAHDFNNILSSIMGYNSLAIEECPVEAPDYLDYLREVAKAGARAQKLVAQLMAFSRPDTREFEVVPPAFVVDEVAKMLKTVIPATIKFALEVEADLPLIRVNQVQFQQVVTNLVINARDAIENGGRITLQAHHTVVNDGVCTSCQQHFKGDFVEIAVLDSGKGISDEHLVRMFEPFFTTKEVGKGTGMGLSMVHGLMHSHEGHIVVDSVIGRGSCFSLYFPVAQATPDAAPQQDEAEMAASGHSATIMVVDDDASITNMLCAVLKKRGHDTLSSTDPKQALEMFMADPQGVDLVITDQVMQSMRGDELARALLVQRPDLPVILCTGYSGSVSEAEIRQSGVKEVLAKPIDFKKLLQLIDKHLAPAAP